MPDLIDIPSPSRKPRVLLIAVAIIAALLFGGGRLLSFYVDALWFHSLGFTEIFRKTLVLQWGLFLAFSALTFALLYGTFLLLRERGFSDERIAALFSGFDIEVSPEQIARHAPPTI